LKAGIIIYITVVTKRISKRQEPDWAIGPEHYKEIEFPKMQLWGAETGHMPFLENNYDLMKAIDNFVSNNQF
jgi:hypothetical protein